MKKKDVLWIGLDVLLVLCALVKICVGAGEPLDYLELFLGLAFFILLILAKFGDKLRIYLLIWKNRLQRRSGKPADTQEESR